MGSVGKIQLPYINKLYNNTHINDQIFQKLQLKPLQDVVLMETDWPEKKWILAKH